MFVQICCFLLSAAASAINAATAFGYAIVMMAILPMLIPSTACTGVAVLGGIAVLVYGVVAYRKYLNFKSLMLPGIVSVIVAVCGLVFNLAISVDLYQLILGLFLMLLSLWFLKFSAKIRMPANIWTGTAVGMLSGICGALFAMNGPPLVLYFNYASKSREEYLASVQFVILMQMVALSITRTIMGTWNAESLKVLPAVLIGSVIGIIPGRMLLKAIDPEKFKTFIYYFMCVVGAYFAIRSAIAIF